MSYSLIRGNEYRRKDVFKIIGIPENTRGGDWDTGFHKFKDDWFIFCNLGIPGSTGHRYENKFIGDDLVWYARAKSKTTHPSIQSLLHPVGKVFIFAREKAKSPFTYWGLAKVKLMEETVPLKITWEFIDSSEEHPEILPEEVTEPNLFMEGVAKKITVNVYERDPQARLKCLRHYGFDCSVCGFNFAKAYGKMGENFIHVHHLKPLAEIKEKYVLNPISDLRPVCPNCHAMIHTKKPPYGIDELKDKLRNK